VPVQCCGENFSEVFFVAHDVNIAETNLNASVIFS
jgi:hypothetical protein